MKISAALVLPAAVALTLLASASSDVFDPFSIQMYGALGIALASFYVGYLQGKHCPLPVRRLTVISLAHPRRYRSIFVLSFFTFSLLGALDRALVFGPNFYLPDLVMAYRVAATQGEVARAIPGLALGNFFIFLAPTFLLAYHRQLHSLLTIAMLAVYLFDIYLTSARSSLFLSMLIAFYFWCALRKIGFRLAASGLVLAVALIAGFDFMAEIVGKASEELSILVYLAGPMHAYDQLLSDPQLLSGYFLSFYPLQALVGTMAGWTPAASELPNVLTPLPVNVYTLFGVLQNDYGFLGFPLCMWVIGFASGSLERTYSRTSLDSVRTWVAINLAVLTLAVFHDYYTTSGVVWMSFLLTPVFFRARPEIRAPTAETRVPGGI